jgi:DNA-binding NarL/FixJ family response regulator
METHNIVIVDDHKIVRDGIKAMLIGDAIFSVVGEAGESKTFFKLLESEVPHLVVLDLKLPGESGLDIAERLRKDFPIVKILILTAEADEPMVRRSIRLGVDGLISKESGREVYLEALYAIADGRSYFGGQFMGMLTQKEAAVSIRLSDREIEVLQCFAKGMTYKEIGAKLGISPRTVETHKEKIQEKLGVRSIAEMVHLAIKEGIVR